MFLLIKKSFVATLLVTRCNQQIEVGTAQLKFFTDIGICQGTFVGIYAIPQSGVTHNQRQDSSGFCFDQHGGEDVADGIGGRSCYA